MSGTTGSNEVRARSPLQEFLAEERTGASLLLVGTVAALVWANISPAGYANFWHADLTVGVGAWSLTLDLVRWINDGLMTLFFFVVGLEIKRELTTGELTSPRVAALPVIAALGGMAVPALLFLAINAGGPGVRGWGIPMATDIAFAVAVLGIAGRGLAPGLRSYLLTLAIVDDIGAILVIALVYSGGISAAPLVVAAAAFGLILAAHRLGAPSMVVLVVLVVLGLVLWVAVFGSGLHATLAGVLLGLATPARARGGRGNAAVAGSPLLRLEHLVHPWTSLAIVPLFALANAGVVVTGGAFGEAVRSPVVLGIVAGLVLGKTIGVSGATWLAVRLGVAELPDGVGWREIVAVGATAGVGFTVALFVAHLAFPRDAGATIGILVASVLAGAVGAALLRRASGRRRTEGPRALDPRV